MNKKKVSFGKQTEEYARVFSVFSSDIQIKLDKILNQNNFNGVIPVEKAELIVDSTGKSIEELMLDLLPIASQYSRAPISNFQVGAISRGQSGNLYLGANTEFLNQSMNVSIHAEQSSINNAWLHGETGITNIATNYSPCGYCRQYLNELATASNLKVLLPDRSPQMLADLLPQAFGPGDLKLESGLMKVENHPLQLQENSNEPIIIAALNAAKKSYAPYSKSYSGVAIQTIDQKIYRGQYSENAAFNPTLSPIQSALANMNLSRNRYQDIERVVLVEMPQKKSLSSQIDITRSLLKSISKVRLEIAYAEEKK